MATLQGACCDAPGWGNTQGDTNLGPLCWKCKGSCFVTIKGNSQECVANTTSKTTCKVCEGLGRLPPKQKQMVVVTCPPFAEISESKILQQQQKIKREKESEKKKGDML